MAILLQRIAALVVVVVGVVDEWRKHYLEFAFLVRQEHYIFQGLNVHPSRKQKRKLNEFEGELTNGMKDLKKKTRGGPTKNSSKRREEKKGLD